MKISIHRTFLKLFKCLLKPASGMQTDGQNSRLPAYNETLLSSIASLCYLQQGSMLLPPSLPDTSIGLVPVSRDFSPSCSSLYLPLIQPCAIHGCTCRNDSSGEEGKTGNRFNLLPLLMSQPFRTPPGNRWRSSLTFLILSALTIGRELLGPLKRSE